jgi:hypothetical protein
MVDLLSLDENSRIVFFSNIYNLVVVHAIIARGYSGTGFYDKCTFLRTTKYNLSGQTFNLLEADPALQTLPPSSADLLSRWSTPSSGRRPRPRTRLWGPSSTPPVSSPPPPPPLTPLSPLGPQRGAPRLSSR